LYFYDDILTEYTEKKTTENGKKRENKIHQQKNSKTAEINYHKNKKHRDR